MYVMLAKFIVLTAMVFAVSGFSGYITSDYEGYVPEDSEIQLTKSSNKRTKADQETSVGVVSVSASDESKASGNDQNINNTGDDTSAKSNSHNEKKESYNTKSGKNVGEVAGQAVENDNPIISCDDPEADCADVTPTDNPTATPTAEPTKPPIPTPTIVGPIITITPLPTIYPCPTRVPLPEVEDTSIAPCIH